MIRFFLIFAAVAAGLAQAQTSNVDWTRVNAEVLDHFQALVRIDTQNPPGNETAAVDYLRKVLEGAGIATRTFALEPNRANLVARIKGSGAARPLLVMAHTDTVKVDPAKWTHPPFSAHREGGYIYGRGTVDDKDNVATALVTALMLKRMNVPLKRDVIFFFEAGEEASTKFGIEYMVNNHWAEIDAELCLAEGGRVARTGGQLKYSSIQTAEKIPWGIKLTSRGPAGHGSVPLQTNAIVHLSQAVAKIAAWQSPMRLNDTTRYYFERLAGLSDPASAARYNGLLDPQKSEAVQTYLAANEPAHNSMIRTSISPNIIKGGYQVNVIPSDAEATLDVRALPDEDMPALIERVKAVIGDPAIQVAAENRNQRPAAPASKLDDTFKLLEEVTRQVFNGIPTLPTMSTGATDMAFLRAKGVQCYGIGPAIDTEDGPKGFGAHSDQERILEASLYQFMRFNWEAVTKLARR
jgi:acetylornithine deacetylase/succinyl-diaminopimelate desuccinylase-like protein